MSGRYELFGRAIDRCQSPIERTFLIELLFSGKYKFEPASDSVAVDDAGIELGQQVAVGDYAIDFTLTRCGSATRFAVELDGHAFHGATPEQFERDSRRQRAITAAGWTFLRF